MKRRGTIDNLEKEWKSMAIHLSHHVPEGYLRDKLHDQLSWLKKQLEHYRETDDFSQVKDYFNEVVDSINVELKLKNKERFKKQ